MANLLSVTTLLLLLVFIIPAQAAKRAPNIVVIMADDLGWNDVGYRDREMVTPNIDKLAAEGVTVNNSYMNQACTPSRAAFFTGVYPYRMGMQNWGLTALCNASLPLQYKLLPESLQELGYSTHMVGKWHLGFCKPEMTPTYRGFDSFNGMYNGKADHFTHISKFKGYDLQNNTGRGPQRNFSVDWSAKGIYSSELFTDRAVDIIYKHDRSKPLFLFLSYQSVHGPFQAPPRYVNQTCAHVTTGGYARKVHCAMTAAMDEGIGKVIAALDDTQLNKSLIIMFISDNGGPVKNGSSNWPLRGSKTTLWEGGTRVVTILHSKKHLKGGPYTWPGLIHAVDWHPTLMEAAGYRGEVNSSMDGMENWFRIVLKKKSKRTEFVYNINDVRDTAALRFEQYKLIHKNPGKPDEWCNPPAGVVNNLTVPYLKYPEYQLFDLEKDPIELNDIANSPENATQEILEEMKQKLAMYRSKIVNSTELEKIEASKPKYHGGVWESGWC